MRRIQFSYTEGFEGIWILWACSIVLTAAITIYALKRLNGERLTRVARDEDGAAYTLSYVLVMPIYTLLVCLVIESSFMLVAKIGSVYASFAAARTAAVWYSTSDPDDAHGRTEEAGIQAFVPFCSGLAAMGQGATNREADEYIKAYEAHLAANGGESASEKYLRAKYQYAIDSVSVDSSIDSGATSEKWEKDIVVTHRYNYPFSVSGIGRIFGSSTYLIESQTRLQIEYPQNEEKRLGISYASPE